MRLICYFLTYSDQFAWANGRFDDIFALNPESCAGGLLQPFFGIVGTAVTVIGASSLLRVLVNIAMKYLNPVDEGDEVPKSSLEFGAFEYAVIRTAHLGLCQAGGYAISVAMYQPVCGRGSALVWALAMCWLLSFPVGFTLYMMFKLSKSKSEKEIKFCRKKQAGSWSAYFSKIYYEEASQEKFCRPQIVHYCIKTLLALAGCLLLFLAISFVSDPANSVVQTVLLFIFGFLSLISAKAISLRPGRKFVIYLANVLAFHLGKKYLMVEGDVVIEERFEMISTRVSKFRNACMSAFASFGAMVQAKAEAMFDPLNLWALSHRGKWVKKDELKVYYAELNDRGVFFSVFLMVKNVILGITLADSPPLVGTVQKVSNSTLQSLPQKSLE